MTGSFVASNAIGLRIVVHGLMHGGNHRLGGIDLEVAQIVAGTAVDVAGALHPIRHGLSHFGAMCDLFFRCAQGTADLSPEGNGTGHCLVPEHTDNLRLRNILNGLVLQVAVDAFGLKTGIGLKVHSFLVGSVSGIHRVAESAAEGVGAGPMNDGGAGAHESNTDDDTDQYQSSAIPFAVFVEGHENSPS